MNNKHYIGKQVSSFEEYEALGPITGIALLVDEDNSIVAGDDSGYMLEMECPYATQAMANNILTMLRGKIYKGYRAENAPLDIIAELGDGITVNGIYSLLAYRNLTFGPGHMSEIAAPGESELEHEYPYISSTQRELNRKIATTRSLIIKTSEEIRLEIQNEVDGLYSSIAQTATEIRSEINDVQNGLSSSITQTATQIRNEIKDVEDGLSSSITQTATQIRNEIKDVEDGLSSSITQTATQIRSEIDDEVSGLNSTITQTNNSLSAKISSVDGRVTTLDADLDRIATRVTSTEGDISTLEQTASSFGVRISSAEGSISSLEQTANSLSSRISGAEGDISSLEQYVDSITLSVSNGSTSSTIKLMAGSTQIASQNITMSGLVTFTGLANGTTTIDGACIKTGLIDADRLNLTGAITFGDLSSSTQNQITNANDTASDAYSIATTARTTANTAKSIAEDTSDTVDGWTYGSTTYIDGTRIMTGTVSASTLEGGEIYLLDSYGYRAGSFTLEGASSYSGRKVVIDSGAIELNAMYGDIYFESGDGVFMTITDRISCGGDIAPANSGNSSCGTYTRLWSDVYCVNAEIQTSDLQVKTEVIYGLDAYESLFDGLRPMSFIFTDGQSGRRHIGIGAQDVEILLSELGISTMDFAAFIKSPLGNESYRYGIRYAELIPLAIEQIQKLKSRVAALEEKIA